jgi:hypothetical protein
MDEGLEDGDDAHRLIGADLEHVRASRLSS